MLGSLPSRTSHSETVLLLCTLQVSPAARDVVAVYAAHAHRGVERDSAVRAAGPGRAGVRHLPAAAGQRPGQRRVPAVLLQAGVQPQRVDQNTAAVRRLDCSARA